MQQRLADLLNETTTVIGLKCTSAEEAIRSLTGLLVETGHVSPAFAEDVWARERTYPTGLPTQPMAVALPHADPDHINRSGIAVGMLAKPVPFGQMGTDGSIVLRVGIVFLLAIKEREKQVQLLQAVASRIQSPALLEGLTRAQTAKQALDLLLGSASHESGTSP